MKHIHTGGFSFDYRAKDTWKHMMAGASVVVAVTDNEIITIRRANTRVTPTEELLNLFKDENLDYLFAEGFKSRMMHLENVKRVLCVSDVNQIFGFNEQYGNPDCIVSFDIQGINRINDVPLIHMPNEVERLAEIVL